MITAQTTLHSEPELIAAAQHGDARAYGELVTRHQAGVVRVVYRMCGDPYLAEEAAQDAFLRAWQHLASYNPEHAFRAWVYRIAVNAALDALRREKPVASLESIEATWQSAGTAGSDPQAAIENRQRAERVQQAVMALPAPSRSVLVLREYGGLSYNEIADTLSIPLGTVMSRLNAARGLLRQELAGVMEVV